MRIALFHNLPSGGAKRTVFEQVKHLANLHQIDVYTLGSADRAFCAESAFAHVHTIPFQPLPLFHRPFRRLDPFARILDIVRLRSIGHLLANLIDRRGYDLALIHPCQFTLSPAILQFLKTPAVYCTHDVNRSRYDPPVSRPYPQRTSLQSCADRLDPLPRLYHHVLDRQDRLSRDLCGAYLTNSYFTRESIYRIYGRAPTVCYPGIDTHLFRPLDLPRKNQVLAVGAILPKKGYDFILHSLAAIPASHRPALHIVANHAIPAEKEYLERLAAGLAVKVAFHLLVDDHTLVSLYSQSALTVYAPVMESFGLAPLESMACGTPVVGIAEGGVRETVVHASNGLLAGRDPLQFGLAIARLLHDPHLAQRLGEQGRSDVLEKWNLEKATNELNAHLVRAASLRPGEHA